jgi:hypothetical protein
MPNILELTLETIETSLRPGDVVEFAAIPLNAVAKKSFCVESINSARFESKDNYIFRLVGSEIILLSLETMTNCVAISRSIDVEVARNVLRGEGGAELAQWLDASYAPEPKIMEGVLYDFDLRATSGPGRKFTYECFRGIADSALVDIEIFADEIRCYLTRLFDASEAIASITGVRSKKP